MSVQINWINYLQFQFGWSAAKSGSTLMVVGFAVAVLPQLFMWVSHWMSSLILWQSCRQLMLMLMLSTLSCLYFLLLTLPLLYLSLLRSLHSPTFISFLYLSTPHFASNMFNTCSDWQLCNLTYCAYSRAFGKVHAITFCLLLHAASIIALGKSRTFIHMDSSYMTLL